MRKLLLKVGLFVIPLLVVIWVVFSLEAGGSDEFYLKFAMPKQRGLILGNSKAAIGIVPHVVTKNLNSRDSQLFNYSFTLTSSPYGKAYLESVRRKLADDTRDGIFILAVDPWSLSVMSENPEDETTFPENHNFLGELEDVSSSPNLHYLMEYYPTHYYNIILRRFRPRHLRLHENGWLEVSVNMDSAVVAGRLSRKIKIYEDYGRRFRFSNKRLAYLGEMIDFLKTHGSVYLVRLPTDARIFSIEHAFDPSFDAKMSMLSAVKSVPYLNFTVKENNYQYTDGNHLEKKSAMAVSREIAEWINEQTTVRIFAGGSKLDTRK